MSKAQKRQSTPNQKEKVMKAFDVAKFLRPVTAEEMEAAFARLAPAVKAMPPEDVRFLYGFSLASAAGIALVTVHQIAEHVLAELEARTDYDRRCLAELQDAGLAASHAVSLARKKLVGARALGIDSEEHKLLVEGRALRQRLGLQVRTLSAAEELPKGALTSLGIGRSFASLSGDLDKLTTFIDASWSGLEGKTFIARSEVDRAGKLVGLVQQVMSTWDEAQKDGKSRRTDVRARVATILMQRHEQARIAVGYVRPKRAERDAIAPTLQAGRARGGRKAPAKNRDVAAPAPASPVVEGAPAAAAVLGASGPAAAAVLGATARVIAGAPTVTTPGDTK